MKKWILLIICCLLCGCSVKDGDAVSSGVSFLRTADGTAVLPLNTEIALTMYHPDLLDQYASSMEDYIHDMHKKIDRHDDYVDENNQMIHNLKTINDSYGSNEFVSISKELFDMIQTSIELTKLTDGKFNLTIGAASNLYEGKFSSMPLVMEDPDETSIQNALSCVVAPDDLDQVIELDEATTSVRLHAYSPCNGKVQLNISAYAKGAVLDEALTLIPRKDNKYMVNLGSSSQMLYAPESADKTWAIGIREPGSTDLLFALAFEDEIMISTSADDQQYYMNEEGIIRHHILDPKTGYSNNTYRSITVFSRKNAGILDALSTVLFNASDSERKEIVQLFEDKFDMEIGYFICIQDDTGYTVVLDEASQIHLMTDYLSKNVVQLIIE